MTTVSSLDGLSVAVTRATHQNEPLRRALERRGARVIEMPLIEIVGPDDGGVALDREVARVGNFDWLVVTSPNGAERVAHMLVDGNRTPKVAVVGDATGRALGCEVTLTAEPATAEALAGSFPEGSGTVLLVQGDLADDTLRTALTTKGWKVTRVEAYRTRARRPGDDAIDASRGADIVLFASGSAVRSWHESVGAPPRCTVVIGPSTAEVARHLGFDVAEIADPHTLEGLVVAAERAAGALRPPDGSRQ